MKWRFHLMLPLLETGHSSMTCQQYIHGLLLELLESTYHTTKIDIYLGCCRDPPHIIKAICSKTNISHTHTVAQPSKYVALLSRFLLVHLEQISFCCLDVLEFHMPVIYSVNRQIFKISTLPNVNAVA